ncbi:hypothetical protein DFQ28_006818 [Apophysomyces sp. BC1034]|nr:hypothetical protein DFQ30_006623 [Apophysomyces sp. BC1015]KAG0176876.1 hypothetical protein DFQ29_005531 [Apophysomyces sp. BC1021]KAG0187137.1 hypothetical protein DFQ28_006818 [Apophysomyces sp. BC1034]
MEGNRFHDPGTPPPIELDLRPRIFEPNHSEEASSSDETLQAAASSSTCDKNNIYEEEDDIDQRRRPSHTDRAVDLVRTITRDELRRKPSKAGVLSNLLKLDLFDNQRRGSQQPQRARPALPRLRTVMSSRAMLQSLGTYPPVWTYSPRAEDEFNKAERGVATDDVAMAARRLQITSEIADILERQDFVIKLGKMLVRTGAPSHRIEAAMTKTSKRLEVDGSYVVLPGLIMVTFGDVETHTSETHLIKCSRALDMGKLEAVNNIAHEVTRGKMTVKEATTLLDDIKNSPPTWNIWYVLLAYMGSSGFIAPLFFNGSWTDCWISACFGLLVGILTFVSEKIPMFGNVFEMVVSVIVSIMALALHRYICFSAVSLAAIAIALPGYSLTSAVMELSAKSIGSGAIHLVHAIMYVLFLGFGLGYGSSVWRLTHPGENIEFAAVCSNPISPYWFFLLLPLACFSIAIVFGASVSQWIPMTANAAVGFVVYYFFSKVTGSDSVVTPSVGAFALGLAGNLYGRLTKRIAFVPLIGGIIILVPGR